MTMAALSRRIVATTKPSIYSHFSGSIIGSRCDCTRVLSNVCADFTDGRSRHYHNRALPIRWKKFLSAQGRFKYWRVQAGAILRDGRLSRDEIIEVYVKLLADVLGSEDEARKRIHSVSTQHFYHFVCDVSPGIAAKIEERNLGVLVDPLSDSDVERTDYLNTGEPFINGKAVPYDPIYHKALLDAYLPAICVPGRVRVWKKKAKPGSHVCPPINVQGNAQPCTE